MTSLSCCDEKDRIRCCECSVTSHLERKLPPSLTHTRRSRPWQESVLHILQHSSFFGHLLVILHFTSPKPFSPNFQTACETILSFWKAFLSYFLNKIFVTIFSQPCCLNGSLFWVWFWLPALLLLPSVLPSLLLQQLFRIQQPPPQKLLRIQSIFLQRNISHFLELPTHMSLYPPKLSTLLSQLAFIQSNPIRMVMYHLEHVEHCMTIIPASLLQ